MKYKAFISYKHSKINKKKVDSIENALKKYAKPLLKPPIKIFRDEKEIRPGDDLKSTIVKALIDSEYLIYMATKEAAESPWVQKEIKYWCDDLKKIDKLIIIHLEDDIIIDPREECIVWDRTNALPEMLENYIDSLPFYANLSWAVKDNDIDLANIEFKKTINGIIAQFRGISPGEMVDEQILIHRRNLRLRNFAVFLLITFSIISLSSAWVAWNQKQVADRRNKESIASGLSTIAGLILPTDNIKAMRIAEMAYKMSLPNPPERVLQALSAVASSTTMRPFYILDLHHEKSINSAVFSPDGAYILTTSLDQTAQLWNLTGKPIAKFKHTNSVDSAVFSPDGTQVLTASYDRKAILWDIKGVRLESYEHTGPVTSAIFSPDGKNILTISGDKKARLWNLNGTCLQEFEHTDIINSAIFSIGGTHIITACNDGTARLWDINGECIAKYKHGLAVKSAVFSPDGKRIMTIAARENSAILWDLNGKKLREFKTEVFDRLNFNSFTSAVFSANGNYILTASTDKTAVLWNIKGEAIKTFRHNDAVNSAFFSPDGTRILTASKDKTAKLWDLEGNLLADFTNHTDSVRKAIFAPDGKHILTASYDNTAKLWRSAGTFCIEFKKEDEYVTDAVFSPIGTHILTISDDYNAKKMKTKEANENKTVKLWQIDGTFLREYPNIGSIESAIFSPDGEHILITTWNGNQHKKEPFDSKGNTVILFDLKGKLLTQYKNHDEIENIIFSPHGNLILVASNNKNAYLWNLEGKLLAEYKHDDKIEGMIFSPESNDILTFSKNTAKLWTQKGQLLVEYQHRNEWNMIKSVSFSPDGNYILIDYISEYYLWDIKGKLLKIGESDFLPDSSPTFSPDGKLILIISEVDNVGEEGDLFKLHNNTIKLQNIKGGLFLECKPTYPANIRQASFSPDGKFIMALLDDYNVYVWDLKGNTLEFKNKSNENRKISSSVFGYIRPSFSPDGKGLLTDFPDENSIKLWDLKGTCFAEYRLPDTPRAVRFSPDNRYIFVQTYGAAELFYTPEGIIDWLKTAQIRELSQEEKKEIGLKVD